MDNKVYFEPTGEDLYSVAYSVEPSVVNNKMSAQILEKICKKEPYNIDATMTLARLYIQNNEYDKACQVRFMAASEIINAIPENEEYFELDWEDEQNQEVIEILTASGTDFYMHGDFEMAATLFETVLALDSQDHMDIMPQLALSYIAIDDLEGYEMISEDIDMTSMVGMLVKSFELFHIGNKNQIKLPIELLQEIKSEEHPVDEAFIIEVDKERVSKSISARELWYKHMPVFEAFNDFTNYCKQL